MSNKQLAKRFWWWWCDPSAPKNFNPAKALSRMFPNKSEEEIRKYYWPELARAVFSYELASRHNKGQRQYLLGRPFHKLSREEMLAVVKLWPCKWPLSEPIRFFPSPPRGISWMLPQYLTMVCSDKEILQAEGEQIAAARKRLNIPDPNGRQRFSFQKIEVLDKWNALSSEDARRTHDSKQARGARRARKEALKLFEEWKEWGGPFKWTVDRSQIAARTKAKSWGQIRKILNCPDLS